MPSLKTQKATKTRILNRFPTREFGLEGDFAISSIKGKGVYLCAKIGNTWYAANKMQELRKLEKTSIMELKTNKLTLNKLQNSTNETEKFLISDNSQVKYRTSDEIKSDLSISIDDIDYKTAYCSIGHYNDKKSCKDNGGTWYYSENDSHDNISSTAENQLLTVGQRIGAMDAEPTLTYDGSTLRIKHNENYDDNWQPDLHPNSLVHIDYNFINREKIEDTDSAFTNATCLHIDGDLTASIPSGRFGTFTGINLDLNSDGANISGGVYTQYGIRVDLTSTDDGVQSNFGLGLTSTGADTNYGITLEIDDGTGYDIRCRSSANTSDYFQIITGADGITTMSTVDSDGAVGHLTMQPDGDLILDPASQKTIINATDALYFDGGGDTYISESSADNLRFVVGGVTMLDMKEGVTDGVFVKNSHLVLDAAKRIIFDGSGTGHTSISQSSADIMTFIVGGDTMFVLDEANDKITSNATNHVVGLADGTEFSVANSAYAGTILGYRMIGEDAIHATYTLTTSMVVVNSDMTVRFIAPPSGAVEVMVQIMFDGTSNRAATFGLSDNATYNSLGNSYEQATGQVDETDNYTHQHYWTITGLTAGDTYNYWFGASANGGTLLWGGTGAGRYPDFIMKVTALPAAVSDFAEYD